MQRQQKTMPYPQENLSAGKEEYTEGLPRGGVHAAVKQSNHLFPRLAFCFVFVLTNNREYST